MLGISYLQSASNVKLVALPFLLPNLLADELRRQALVAWHLRNPPIRLRISSRSVRSC
ncbi:hypothetical protein SPHV1_2280126 [Novosphingobium sp. KN65.2]|nr:hypothetical protein SPHV1_2280126 [Novosphingobium sp. KN65.2]